LFPVSQTANINAGESSKINKAMIILINTIFMLYSQKPGSYTQRLSIYPQNWIFSRSFQPVVHKFCQEIYIAFFLAVWLKQQNGFSGFFPIKSGGFYLLNSGRKAIPGAGKLIVIK
jgi:hypothetical protein